MWQAGARRLQQSSGAGVPGHSAHELCLECL